MKERNISIKYIILFIVLFIGILTMMRIGWLTFFQDSQTITAEDGRVDLTQATFDENNTYALNGEWRFIADEYVDVATFEQRMREGTTELIDVPGNWADKINVNGSGSPIGKGTYYLHVTLPEHYSDVLGIYMKRIKTASDIYLNDQQIMKY